MWPRIGKPRLIDEQRGQQLSCLDGLRVRRHPDAGCFERNGEEA